MTVTLTREEAQQVLDVIERNIVGVPRYRATELLRARLAQPEPEPVGEIIESHGLVGVSIPNMPTVGTKLYTAPPQRELVELTDEEAKKTFEAHNCTISADLAGILARAIKAKLKEKNT